jgi:hypothetical protein
MKFLLKLLTFPIWLPFKIIWTLIKIVLTLGAVALILYLVKDIF